eukprot:Selendium_serpulae@DN4952_c0_g1_i3.p1
MSSRSSFDSGMACFSQTEKSGINRATFYLTTERKNLQTVFPKKIKIVKLVLIVLINMCTRSGYIMSQRCETKQHSINQPINHREAWWENHTRRRAMIMWRAGRLINQMGKQNLID